MSLQVPMNHTKIPKKQSGMARKYMIYIIFALIIIGTTTGLSLVIRAKNQKIHTVESEIKSKNEQIASLRADLELLKKEMEAGLLASEIHNEKVSEASNEYIKKIEFVQADPDARDWFNQPLPSAIVYNFGDRVCENSNH